MDWSNCISHERIGQTNSISSRSQYQRDFDRLIFSSAFRRLQNKTQVFPLPGNTFVHNRLTHSLEVASVGRSLGSLIGNDISNLKGLKSEIKEFYKYDLSSVIAAGCLAHDIGNPPFGHSGESAISEFFITNKDTLIEGLILSSYFEKHEWSDLTNFEGNANALHILTNEYPGKLQGGLALTYSTLASIIKYPCNSLSIDKSQKHLKKYGYLKKDQKIIENIASNTNMILQDETNYGKTYKRHPFVYIVEAADDICYRIIDLEDAHRIKIIQTSTLIDIFLEIITDLKPNNQYIKRTKDTINKISDNNEKISYLRAKTINILVNLAHDIFNKNENKIINGTWNNTLFDCIQNESKGLLKSQHYSVKNIYNHPSVIQLEITGFNVLQELLKTFVPIVLKNNLTSLESKTLHLIPDQFTHNHDANEYIKTLGIIDFIAGMTDGFATEYYRKTKGIIINGHE